MQKLSPEAFIEIINDFENIKNTLENENQNSNIPKDILEMVESDLDDYFEGYSKPLTGFCRIRWAKKKEFLEELGYDWKSPEDLFPFVHFD